MYVKVMESRLRDLGFQCSVFFASDVNDKRPTLSEVTIGRHIGQNLVNRIRNLQPDVVHLHNLYHRFSPLSLWSVANYLSTNHFRVLWTLHDGHVLAPESILVHNRRGRVTEATTRNIRQPLGWDANKPVSLAKWLRWVLGLPARRSLIANSRLISPSLGLAERVQARYPSSETIHLPNPVDISAAGASRNSDRSGFVYVGRICRAKGAISLLESAEKAFLDRLTMVGPFEPQDESRCRELLQKRQLLTTLTGRIDSTECRKIIGTSKLAIFPTQGFENASLSLADALAMGTPVMIGEMNGLAPQLRGRSDVVVYDSLSPESTRSATREIIDNCPVPLENRDLGGCFVPTEQHVSQYLEIAGLV